VDASKGSSVEGAHTWPAAHPAAPGGLLPAHKRATAFQVGGATSLVGFGAQAPPVGVESDRVKCVPPQPPSRRFVQVVAIAWSLPPQDAVQLPSVKKLASGGAQVIPAGAPQVHVHFGSGASGIACPSYASTP
jgi:hypothetical protein